MKELLNPYQWNSLRGTLQSFEECLRRAQAWLAGEEERGTLYERKLTLRGDHRKQAESEIQHALELIEDLSRSLELPVETENSAALIRGEMSIAWANLLDSQAQKLGRYGRINPDLAKALDPKVERLAEIAQSLSGIFGEYP
jgi:hypothetical protein